MFRLEGSVSAPFIFHGLSVTYKTTKIVWQLTSVPRSNSELVTAVGVSTRQMSTRGIHFTNTFLDDETIVKLNQIKYAVGVLSPGPLGTTVPPLNLHVQSQ